MKYQFSVTLICFLGAFLIGVILVWPKYQSYLEVAQTIENKKSFFENQSQYFQKLQAVLEDLQKEKEAVAKVNAALPSSMEFSSLVNYLQKVSSENGLAIQKIAIGNITSLKDMERIKEHHISIGLSGSYSSFESFLARLEKSSRLFEIEEILFTVPKTESDFFNFTLKLKVHSY
jgi:Tfp pilus assembly protein PilO